MHLDFQDQPQHVIETTWKYDVSVSWIVHEVFVAQQCGSTHQINGRKIIQYSPLFSPSKLKNISLNLQTTVMVASTIGSLCRRRCLKEYYYNDV